MGYYINDKIGYYEGDKISHVDIEVTKRPSTLHSWDGTKWFEDSQLVKLSNIEALSKTDTGFIRVIEDVINTMISKKIIALSDLPATAQEKYQSRKTLRDKIK